MAKTPSVLPPEKKKPRGHGWRTKPKVVAKEIILTEEEQAAQQEALEVEQKRRSGPIRSKKIPLSGGPHLTVRVHQHTLDWLAAEAQVRSTTVSQLVRGWVEEKERNSYIESQRILRRGDATNE